MAEEDLTKAKADAVALEWVPAFDEALTGVETKAADAATARTRATDAAALYAKALEHKARHKRAATATISGVAAVDAAEGALRARKRVSLLAAIITDVERHTVAARLKVPDTTAMETARDRYLDAEKAADALRELYDDIQKKEARQCRLEKALEKAVAAIPKTCPTCGQSLPPISTSK